MFGQGDRVAAVRQRRLSGQSERSEVTKSLEEMGADPVIRGLWWVRDRRRRSRVLLVHLDGQCDGHISTATRGMRSR